jgi:queuine tRNA-ribosyltransferase
VKSGEILGARLLTLHNVTFYQQLVGRLRDAISRADDLGFQAVAAAAAQASVGADLG